MTLSAACLLLIAVYASLLLLPSLDSLQSARFGPRTACATPASQSSGA